MAQVQSLVGKPRYHKPRDADTRKKNYTCLNFSLVRDTILYPVANKPPLYTRERDYSTFQGYFPYKHSWKDCLKHMQLMSLPIRHAERGERIENYLPKPHMIPKYTQGIFGDERSILWGGCCYYFHPQVTCLSKDIELVRVSGEPTLCVEYTHTLGRRSSLPLTWPSFSYFRLCEWVAEKDRKERKNFKSWRKRSKNGVF